MGAFLKRKPVPYRLPISTIISTERERARRGRRGAARRFCCSKKRLNTFFSRPVQPPAAAMD